MTDRAGRDLALLINPSAGKGRALAAADVVVPRLRAAGFAVRSLTGADADEALELARRAVADGVEALVVVGGDGMVNIGLQATATTSTPLGLVPAGTGNDVARYLGLDRKDPLAAADRIVRALTTGERRRLDLAVTGGRYYVTVMAAGFDAVVNERANQMRWPKGQMRYNLATVRELRTFKPLSYVLDVVVIKPISKPELLRTYPKLFTGTHTSHPQYERHRVRRVTIAAPGVVGYADGERFGPLPLTIECVPGALEVVA